MNEVVPGNEVNERSEFEFFANVEELHILVHEGCSVLVLFSLLPALGGVVEFIAESCPGVIHIIARLPLDWNRRSDFGELEIARLEVSPLIDGRGNGSGYVPIL